MDGREGAGTSTAPMTLATAKRLGRAGTLGLAGKCLVAHLERLETIEAAAREVDEGKLGGLPILHRALDAEVRPWR